MSPSRAYRAARLLAEPDLETIADGALVVDGQTLRYAGPANGAPPADETSDLGDVTLLPGLIDCHTQLVWDAPAEPHTLVSAESPLRTVLRAARHSREHLTAGVTTIRDLGPSDGLSIPLARAIEAGKQANFFAVGGDPTVDIGALTNVRLVVARGAVINL